MRRLRLQLTVLLALLGMHVLARGRPFSSGQGTRNLAPLVQRVAAEYRAWVRTGQTELKARREGARAAALVAARGNADQHFQELWRLQAQFEDQLPRAHYSYAGTQDRTYATTQTLAVRTALMQLGALVLLALWLRRAVGAPADALRSASGRLAAAAWRPRSP